ncbi:hypothetical protein CHARACLAT_031377 [Characodon lateralis]|uniref:Uncharacterized protein n=1 Tax=Characodon lateralis TaxID=208331 RepID=A0ABU7DFR9_9TELE|nr:hypothetical protein [Characodon lateralis]
MPCEGLATCPGCTLALAQWLLEKGIRSLQGQLVLLALISTLSSDSPPALPTFLSPRLSPDSPVEPSVFTHQPYIAVHLFTFEVKLAVSVFCLRLMSL